jgi:hypothetical protein
MIKAPALNFLHEGVRKRVDTFSSKVLDLDRELQDFQNELEDRGVLPRGQDSGEAGEGTDAADAWRANAATPAW